MTRALPPWTGSHPDAAIPPRVQARLMLAQEGRCADCGRKIGAGGEKFAADHRRALVNGGRHAEDNLQLLCVSPCHASKSKVDVAEKSRSARLYNKNNGIKAKSGRGFRSWRGLDGSIRYAADRRR